MNNIGYRLSSKSAYFIAFATVFMLTVVNQVLIQKVLREQKDDASVINLAGRQRMLSQKITKGVLLSQQGKISLQSLKNDASFWQVVHEGIQNGNELLNLPGLNNQHILGLFDDLTPHLNAISLPLLEATQAEDITSSIGHILENEKIFLVKMDVIVAEMERSSRLKIRNLIYLEVLLALSSLLILIFEFKYIFKPLFDRLKDENDYLERNIKELVSSKGALFKDSQRFTLSLEAINAGIWDWNIPDGSEWWSDRFYKLLGYKKERLLLPMTRFYINLFTLMTKKR